MHVTRSVPETSITPRVSESSSKKPAERQRVSLLVGAYGIGIILVVMGHALPSVRFTGGSASGNPLRPLFDWIYTFHMPLYFCLAGMTFGLSNTPESRHTWIQYVSSRFVRLLWPYLVLNTIAFPLRVFMARNTPHRLERSASFEFSIESFTRSFLYPWTCSVTYLWFLPTLFLISMLALPLWKRIQARPTAQSASALAILTLIFVGLTFAFPERDVVGGDTFWNYGGAFHYLLYFWLGMLGARYDALQAIEIRPVVQILPAALLMSVFQLSVFYRIRADNLLKSPVPALVLAVLGIVNTLLWSKVALCYLKRVLLPLGMYGYQIYLISWFVQIPTLIITTTLLKLPIVASTVIAFVVGLLIPLGLAEVLAQRCVTQFVWLGFAPSSQSNRYQSSPQGKWPQQSEHESMVQ